MRVFYSACGVSDAQDEGSRTKAQCRVKTAAPCHVVRLLTRLAYSKWCLHIGTVIGVLVYDGSFIETTELRIHQCVFGIDVRKGFVTRKGS